MIMCFVPDYFQVYKNPSGWENSLTVTLGGIISGLSVNQLDSLTVNSTDTLFAIGNYGDWSNKQKVNTLLFVMPNVYTSTAK